MAPTLVEIFGVTSCPLFSIPLQTMVTNTKTLAFLFRRGNCAHENRLKGLKNVKDKGEICKLDCAGDTASPSNGGRNTDKQPWEEGRWIMELSVVLTCFKSMFQLWGKDQPVKHRR